MQFTNQIIARTPYFTTQSVLKNHFDELKTMIATASPEFHKHIADLSYEDLGQLDEKARYSIWKYFNRAKYRATPFGAFAAISLIDFKPNSINAAIISRDVQLHEMEDWSYTKQFNAVKKVSIKDNTLICINPSSYRLKDEIRYFSQVDAQFELSSLSLFPELEKLIDCCQEKTTLATLRIRMPEVDEKTIKSMVKQLVDLQLLFVELQPNITGEDFFRRRQITSAHETKYIIAERKCESGEIDQLKFRTLKAYIDFVRQVLPQLENNSLKEFKNAFSKKFEQQELPLSVVLDPSVGIGYQNTAQPTGQDELIGKVKPSESAAKSQVINYGKFEQFLLQQLIKGETIDLTGFTPVGDVNDNLPNTTSALAHFYQDKLVIDTLGGSSASVLVGRFTHLPAIKNYSKQLTQLESDANPEVIFFDIAYQAEGRVDNVNRRAQLYPAEMAISSWSTHQESIQLADILVSIQSNEIVLRSRKNGKRLVPRLASAYNYTRSDFPLLLFLCDLQHQNLQTNLQFDLQQQFPNLDYYPRVTFKNIVVNAAKWKIPNELKLTLTKKDTDGKKVLKFWLDSHQIDFLIKIGQGDQYLCFDPMNEEDLQMLSLYLKQQPNSTPIYVAEALLGDTTDLRTIDGDQFYTQFNAHLYHEANRYQKFNFNPADDKLNRSVFLPGSEWLYFEIYANPAHFKEIHLLYIAPLLRKFANSIKQWFFIHYNQPSHHIRLRLKLKDAQDLSSILAVLNGWPLATDGYDLIHQIQLKSYERELARYGQHTIKLAEELFYEDSKQIMTTLGKYDDELAILSAMNFVKCLSQAVFVSIDQQLQFYQQIADQFAKEMKFDTDHFKQINDRYKNLRLDTNFQKPGKSLQIFKKILSKTDQQHHFSRLADFIHMHVNRRFVQDQRLYEAIIYQFMVKHTQRERASAKQPRKQSL